MYMKYYMCIHKLWRNLRMHAVMAKVRIVKLHLYILERYIYRYIYLYIIARYIYIYIYIIERCIL